MYLFILTLIWIRKRKDKFKKVEAFKEENIAEKAIPIQTDWGCTSEV